MAKNSFCAASSESIAVYARLGSGQEKWVSLPRDKKVWEAKLPVYLSYDEGSVARKRDIAYVRVKYGSKGDNDPTIYVLAAHCKKHRIASIALGKSASDAGVSVSIWNKGNIRFKAPNDGGDYTIWPIPSRLADVDTLFKNICGT